MQNNNNINLKQSQIDNDEFLLFSQNGHSTHMKQNQVDLQSGKNIYWSSDCRVEMPIMMKKTGQGAEVPITLIQQLQQTVKQYGQNKALNVKRNGKWISWNYIQYYEENKIFAKALIKLGIQNQKAVNIIGFNSPEWFFSFYGSIFGGYLPIGVYGTNNSQTCQYLMENSQGEVAIVENKHQLQKYLDFWDQYEDMKYVIIYNDKIPDDIPEKRKSQVLLWNDLMKLGQSNELDIELDNRMSSIKPGTCCTLVYTSGTTGNPKGVILSHDNYTWTAKRIVERNNIDQVQRIVSYLPLSHVASQVTDIITPIIKGCSIYFADEKALQGTLVQTLQEVRPELFFGVPRVWEKIEDKLKQIGLQNGSIKSMISSFAKARGIQGSFQEQLEQETSNTFKIAKSLVYNKVKYALGLDQCKVCLVGAAPLSLETKKYFASLNIMIINAYGMSECSGPQTMTEVNNFNNPSDELFNTAGTQVYGSDMIIHNMDKDGQGEICYKGRNRFVGYHNNEEETKKTIDKNGFLHSGDIGQIDKNGNLYITGRLKELIITAGGENIAPVLIEQDIKLILQWISNVMIIGDKRKYLVVLLTFKLQPKEDGTFTDQLSDDAKLYLKQSEIDVSTLQEAKQHPKVKKLIDEAISKVNSKTISRASRVQKWHILNGDFTINGGELTPSMKLKRKVTENKYIQEIEALYLDPAL